MSEADRTVAPPAPSTLDAGAPVPAASVATVPEPDFGAGPARPELPIAGAFAGGVLAALVLKRLGR